MSKGIKAFLFALLSITLPIIFANKQAVFASHTIDDSIISITQNPIPVKTDSGQVTFTITATRDIFDTGQLYSNIAWRDGGVGRTACSASNPPQATSNPKKITFTWKINGCRAVIGTWHFVMWRGSTILGDTPTGNILILDYVFSVEQAGGGVLQIIPVKTPLGLSETPYVNLINARKDNQYTFWWDGAATEFAQKYKATTDGNMPNLELNKKGVDFNVPGKKTLCMDVGDLLTPIGQTCRYRAEFEFTAIPPPPPTAQPDCSIQPAIPIKDDSVSIKATNLPLNQEFRADLVVSNGSTINPPTRQNSGSSGVVFLNLASHLGEGNYTASVYDANHQRMCFKDFIVGPRTPGAVPSATPCTGASCTKAGGDPCGDASNPGIKTAVGCIHTNPVDFIKDALKFLTAIGGGLAFLMMLLGAFQMITSAGNPETLQAGKDRFTSAIIGLLFIIFTVLLLQIIGVGILNIPGFKP